MKTYAKYIDSGIKWIGQVPKHWEVKRIRHIADIYGRIGYRGYKVTDLVQKGNGSITISPSNMKAFHMDFDNCTYLSWDKYMESPEIMIYNGDILFVKTGSTYGKSSFVQDLPEKATINPQIIVLKNIVSDNKLLWYIIISNNIQYQVEQSVVGGTIPTISQARINNYLFPIPPTKKEQTEIANYLDRKTADLDHLITEKKQLVKLYEEEKTAIINQAVTKGINPNARLKDSGIGWLGDIPEHWEVKKLKYLLDEKLMYGANESAVFENKDHPRFIRITDFGKNGELKNTTFKSLPPEKANSFLLSEGDVLFARSGATVGKTFQFKNYIGTACFAGYLIKAKPNTQLITSDFLYKFTKSGFYENWKDSIFNKATIQNIGADKYAVLDIPKPPVSEQIKIIDFIEQESKRIDAKIKKAKKYIKLLTEYRTALISEVVTGKIKVTK